jgi:hypothetical protein
VVAVIRRLGQAALFVTIFSLLMGASGLEWMFAFFIIYGLMLAAIAIELLHAEGEL